MTTMPRDEHGFIKVACPTCGEQLFGVQEWSAGDPIAEAMTAELRAQREENERLTRERDIARRNETRFYDTLCEERVETAELDSTLDTARRERDEAVKLAEDAIKLAIDRRQGCPQPGCFACERQRRETDALRARLAKLRAGTEGSGT